MQQTDSSIAVVAAKEETEDNFPKTNTVETPPLFDTFNNDQKFKCNSEQTSRFLKTVDFELHEHDDALFNVLSLEECIELCEKNVIYKVFA